MAIFKESLILLETKHQVFQAGRQGLVCLDGVWRKNLAPYFTDRLAIHDPILSAPAEP